MRLRSFLLALVMFMTAFVYVGDAAVSGDKGLPDAQDSWKDREPLEYSTTWAVVNLFSGKTSKQAERVRETLMRLGARGQGIVIPYENVTVENITRLKPAFLALSPNGVPWCRYTGKHGENLKRFLSSLKVIIEDMKVPVIGICGGHQALALAFGGKVGPIRGGEDDCFSYGKNPTERGRHDVSVVDRDPLFVGMGKTLNLVQNHFDEVKKLPPGFITLAENPLCRYQIIRHPTLPAYGVQAHTEYYLKSRPDGGTLLRNFLNIAQVHNQLTRKASAGEYWKADNEKKNRTRSKRVF